MKRTIDLITPSDDCIESSAKRTVVTPPSNPLPAEKCQETTLRRNLVPSKKSVCDRNLFSFLERAGLKAKLLTHQLEAVRWWTKKEGLNSEGRGQISGGILADEMGLGKTLSCIASSLLGRLMDINCAVDENPKPTLVVCPKGLIKQWIFEILDKTNLNESDVHMYYGQAGRSIKEEVLSEKRFVITTYDTVSSVYKSLCNHKGEITQPLYKRGPLFGTCWNRIVLDEAHKIKNPKTKLNKSVCHLASTRRWCLTGTPYNNALSDLAAECKFIGIMPYGEAVWWQNATQEQLSQWRSQFLLRRTKSILSLPPITTILIRVSLTFDEFEFYNKIAQDAEANFDQFLRSSGVERRQMFQEILVWLLRLRQCCCDRLLLLGRGATLPFSNLSKANINRFIDKCNYCYSKIVRTTHQDVPDERVEPTKRRRTSRCIIKEEEDSEDDDDDSSFCDPMDIDTSQDSDGSRPYKNTNKVKGYCRFDCGHVFCVECGGKINVCTICKYEPAILTVRESNQEEKQDGEEEQDLSPPILLDGCFPHEKPKPTIKHAVSGYSSKTCRLMRELQQIFSSDGEAKIVIFSQWTSYLDLIENAIQNEFHIKDGVGFVRMDGDIINIESRNNLIQQFTNDPKIRILLTSLSCGGLGLNLICANYVILMDSWYNPFTELQAIERVHRIGQNRPVTVIKIVTRTEIDDALLEIQEKKKEQSKYCIQGQRGKITTTGLNIKEIQSILARLIESRKKRKAELQKIIVLE